MINFTISSPQCQDKSSGKTAQAVYLLGLGFCFKANSSSQRSASVRDSNRLLNRKSSIFLNKSFSRRNRTCLVGPFCGIGRIYKIAPIFLSASPGHASMKSPEGTIGGTFYERAGSPRNLAQIPPFSGRANPAIFRKPEIYGSYFVHW